MSINYRLDKYFAWQGEVIVKRDLMGFLTGIGKFQIGFLLDKETDNDKWLLGYIKDKCKRQPSPITQQILGYEITENENIDNGDGISVLFIDLENN